MKFLIVHVTLEEGKMLILTDEDILTDIEGFNQRIKTARSKLAELPEAVATWKARKKL